MYVAVVCMLLSEATYFRSWALLLYAVLAWLLFHAFVLCYEEPRLRDKFGVLWEQYGRAVPRWGIARRPYTPTTTQAGRRGGRQV
jgi:protein-S-isoprenylcysteine O-methyltransferase Ste14